MIKKEMVPDIIAAGDQLGSKKKTRALEVPVGLEQVLFLAAKDDAFKSDLLADRNGAITRKAIRLRPTEAATLSSISNDALKSMIAGIRPDNPKRRTLMRTVAAAAASLAAGTALISCDDDKPPCRGSTPDTYSDADVDADADADGGGDSDDTEEG